MIRSRAASASSAGRVRGVDCGSPRRALVHPACCLIGWRPTTFAPMFDRPILPPCASERGATRGSSVQRIRPASARRTHLASTPGRMRWGEKLLFPARVAVRWPPHHHGATRIGHFRDVYSNSAARAPNPQLGVARMSKPRNARRWFSSTCAVPRQSDEALAKSSAKQINFSRNAGSLISRNAFIKRTPSLGFAASDSRSLLTRSSRLLFLVLSFTIDRSKLIVPTFV